MKVGDVIYIESKDRNFRSGEYTVTKMGNKYFSIDDPWVKFLVDGENGNHPDGYDSNRGIRTKDSYMSQLFWYPSKAVFNKREEATKARTYIEKNLYLMDADELIDFANLLKEREQDVVRSK